MITVEEAERIVLSQLRDYGVEAIGFEHAAGRILAEDIVADRNLPPFNRVTVDGIAISARSFSSGNWHFKIAGTQAAGDQPLNITAGDECVEIMTGAALPPSADTVIRYEDIAIKDGLAEINIEDISIGQNIHFEGADKKRGDVLVKAGRQITAPIVGIAASVGKAELMVKKLPRVVVITSGDELVNVEDCPGDYQIRRSNNYTVSAVLQKQGVAVSTLHIPDDELVTEQVLEQCINNYDVLILSGGVSMGKFDYIPKALENLQITKLFHKVKQRPGKPFWFGGHANGAVVFAFPGNPVATFMCLHKYFLNWLYAGLGVSVTKPIYAVLASDFAFKPDLSYFLQVALSHDEQARLVATPVEGNGSGDFANLADSDAFIELPAGRDNFMAGELFKVISF
ncbi:molybdopterin molybdotransferase MoeA [Mucilaginibacter pallidiroseus]|uniref:Molybdopterin molybdenumtransferase n=1 Tax=Mucilaginibacter pallidiroseus TaxID=2599295 RepID=A0A563UJF4_9SPHI|nr:molybdopterin molybdotransferase MoeA [Mucilaginibacter pallidiroseus]TWR31443.1 molybdopterin molybdotransferase MoeA [Mucilaginibacter pallidiroseus]